MTVAEWRANDVVEYDDMRESATELMGLLSSRASFAAADRGPEIVEIAHLRRDVLTVDGYDRAAVADLARRIAERRAGLSGATA